MFNKVCIIGLGLIGGSISLDIIQNNLAKEIIGYDKLETLIDAKTLSIIDDYSLDLAIATKDADLVIIATPVNVINDILTQLKPIWNNKTIYMDVGSTKQNIVNHVLDIFEVIPKNLILTHPIAGSEKSGILSAQSNLFEDKELIITPIYKPNPKKLDIIKKFWLKLGSNITMMKPWEHDSIFSGTSHLPHLLAFALTNMLSHEENNQDTLKFAGSGFKDFTRLASSNPEMWSSICVANKTNLIPLIEQFRLELFKLQHLLENNNNNTELKQYFTKANEFRTKLL